jgi:dUTP pyrophosphatase
MKIGDLVVLKNNPSGSIYRIIKVDWAKLQYNPFESMLFSDLFFDIYIIENVSNSADKLKVDENDIVPATKENMHATDGVISVKLDNGARMPEKAHETDAGFDLFAPRDFVFINDECIIDTGVHIAIPRGYVGYIQGRSGLNMTHSVICPTGTVDSGYTGSIKVKLYNLSLFSHYTIKAGDKIAQLVIQPIAQCGLVRVDSLEETERGDGGFGSTGR